MRLPDRPSFACHDLATVVLSRLRKVLPCRTRPLPPFDARTDLRYVLPRDPGI